MPQYCHDLKRSNPKATLPSAGTISKQATLKEPGISGSAAKRLEKVAAIPEEKFEAVIDQAKKNNKPVTYADVEKAVSSGANRWGG